MNRKNVCAYLLALCALFAVSCVAALLLREYDRRAEDVTPLAEGRQLSFPLCGFALTVPEDAQVLEADPGAYLYYGFTHPIVKEEYRRGKSRFFPFPE